RWARVSTGDADEAEDVAQSVLLRLQRSIRVNAVGVRFNSWLFRVTRNVVLDRARAERRRRLLLDAASRDASAGPEASAEDPERAPPLEPIVRSFLDVLTPRQQEVFEFVDLNGLTAAEAAARLGIKASTARVLLMQARRTMRLKMLEQHPNLLEDYWR
ncbi:MAG: RNA polymerase sigma factor, partial [Gemmatimonadaceae bacterium]|nr:RNA polymerase sigma factor [Gemmatimonadaceae bacterium]